MLTQHGEKLCMTAEATSKDDAGVRVRPNGGAEAWEDSCGGVVGAGDGK